MFNNIRIVLVATSHPGNIGAAARAMKTMGLHKLYLVRPKIFPNVEATARAAGADDILAKAVVVDTLEDALIGCSLVVGTSARVRTLPIALLNPREAATQIITDAKDHEVAILFGRENNGLSNEELQRCHYHIYIPTNPEFGSLNLASALQIIAYELMFASMHESEIKPAFIAKQKHVAEYDEPVSVEEMELFYQHLERVLIDAKFLNPKQPRRLMQRLRRFFGRARPEKMEMNILRGILTAVEKYEPGK
jgi:TrmH family RNA methyltransferase